LLKKLYGLPLKIYSTHSNTNFRLSGLVKGALSPSGNAASSHPIKILIGSELLCKLARRFCISAVVIIFSTHVD